MRNRLIALPVVLALFAGACGDVRDSASSGGADAEKTVRASLAAENAKDADGFLALWTDKGLKEYDVGSRADVKAGKSENFGTNKVTIVSIHDTKAQSDEATTTLDATVGESKVAAAIQQVKFKLVKQSDKWLIDGVEFIGGPEAPAGTKVISIKGDEYAFLLDTTEAPTDVAFTFENVGKEQHEISFFKGPDGVDIATAKAALENVDGSELKDIPAGYAVDHLSFAEVGKKVNVTFKDELKPGTYVFACYIPQGGFGDDGPVNPEGKPHIKLGMINTLTVK